MDRNHSRRDVLRSMTAAAASLSAWPRMACAQQRIRHTLWVVDHIGPAHLIGNQVQTVLGAIGVLNLAFMAPLVTNPLADSITAQLSATPNFAPGDAVVFLVLNPARSVLPNSPTKPSVLGKSAYVPGAPSICEVYWERCFNDLEVAGALFHEAAHGMSQQDDDMHDYRSSGIGGPGVRVLAEQQQGVPKLPSYADLEFYAAAIRRRTTFVTSVP